MLVLTDMNGFITERDFQEAEAAFPGIEAFYRALRAKPVTFLDLMRLYGRNHRWTETTAQDLRGRRDHCVLGARAREVFDSHVRSGPVF